MTEGTVKVVLVDDDAIVRQWVRMALTGTEFRLVGEASDADEAERLIARRCPDLLLVDQRLPERTGAQLVRDLHARGDATPALLITARPERGFNETAREATAQGTALKTGRADELTAAMRTVAGGGRSYDPRHPRRDPGRAALSPREREVIRLVAEGATNRQIAAALAISDETVKTLVARTFGKLGVNRRAEAVSVAHEEGLL